MGYWEEKKLEDIEDKFEKALEIMREYHDAEMQIAKQSGQEDMGDVDAELIMRRASAGAAICRFYRENSAHSIPQ